ncbi:hypothetical protein D3C80_1035930 [compost metagenome]
MAVGATAHAADIEQWRAVGRRLVGRRIFQPALLVDLIVQRREAGEQGEHAADRAQIAAPDALAATIEKTHQHRRHGGATENQQRRLGIIIDADQLAIDGGQDERQGRPAAPANPARRATAQAAPADPLAEGAFGAEHTAPESAEQQNREQHEGPPDPPEDELGEQGQVVEDARLIVRQRQQGWRDQQQDIKGHDCPLHAADEPTMSAQGIAKAADGAVQLAHAGHAEPFAKPVADSRRSQQPTSPQ